MRLEPYTPEQTDKLLVDIDFIIKNGISINDIAVQIIKNKYQEYVKNYKWKWWQWKPYSEDEFVAHLACSSRFITISRDLIEEYSKEPVELYEYWKFHGFYVKWLEDNKVTTISEFELKILEAASTATGFLRNDIINQKYKALTKYAHRPFEFDETDILWLERVEETFNTISKFVGETQWTTNLQKINP